MTKKNNKARLGRGISGILTSGGKAPVDGKAAPVAVKPVPAETEYRQIPVASIKPSRHQPRRTIEEEGVKELADSIRAEGLLQPVVVRAAGQGFELIAGERRWRAFQQLGRKEIPARVMQVNEASSAALALIENLQREQLNPMEEAKGYASLIRDFDLTQEEAAERVGKARATVANLLRLLSLNAEIQGFIVTGRLSTGHAKVLLGVESEAVRTALARRIVQQGMSVREAEEEARQLGRKATAGKSRSGVVDPAEQTEIRALEKKLEGHFRAPVRFQHSAKKGRIIIEYAGNEDLNRILDVLGVGD